MKKVLLLGSSLDLKGSKNNILDIRTGIESAVADSFTVRTAYIEDLYFYIDDNTQLIIDTVTGLKIDESDLVICMNWYQTGEHSYYRDIMFTVALYLQNKGVRFWNSEALNQRSTTKLSMMMQLALEGISIPRTTFSLNHDYLINHVEANSFPAIVKTIKGSRGSYNYLANDEVEFNKILNKKHPFMIQEFIPNDHDLRVVCFGSRAKLVIKRSRVSDDTHLNNTSQGAKAELVDLNKINDKIKELVYNICTVTNREIAGVDLLFSNDGTERIVCLEVNAIPQLTSGSYVPEKYEALTASINEVLKGKV